MSEIGYVNDQYSWNARPKYSFFKEYLGFVMSIAYLISNEVTYGCVDRGYTLGPGVWSLNPTAVMCKSAGSIHPAIMSS